MTKQDNMRSIVASAFLVACANQPKLAPRPQPSGIDPLSACASVTGGAVRELFYPVGQLAARAGCRDGKLEGEYATFHPSGTPRAVGRHEAGRRTGTWREWHANGHLWIEGAYVAGRESGRWVEYHATGAVKFEGTYKDGLLVGEWTSYCENDGKLHAKGESVAGKLEGTIVVNRCRNDVRTEQLFVRNRPQGVWRTYVAERLVSDWPYENGVLDGDAHGYDDKGAVKWTDRYVDGLDVEEDDSAK